MMAGGADRGRVKDGRAPRMDCFCNRMDCMAELVRKWVKEKKDPALTCAICSLSNTTRWRVPGSILHACRILYSRRDPQHPERSPFGSTLGASSILCHKCYSRGCNFRKKLSTADKLSVREHLELAGAPQSPAPHSLAGAMHSTRLCFLNTLDSGEFVYLEDGVKVYEEARLEAKQPDIGRKSLVKDVQTMLKTLGHTLTDAEFVTFSAAETGSNDGRRKAQYVMPSRVSHRQHAMVHQRALAAEAELAKYKEDVKGRRKGTVEDAAKSLEQEKLRKVQEAAEIVNYDTRNHQERRVSSSNQDAVILGSTPAITVCSGMVGCTSLEGWNNSVQIDLPPGIGPDYSSVGN